MQEKKIWLTAALFNVNLGANTYIYNMLVIRFARRGRKGRPFYHIVLAEKHRAVQKKFIQKLGWFDPLAEGGKGAFELDKEAIIQRIAHGAQPSNAAARLMKKAGIAEAEKFIAKRVMKPKKEAPAQEVVAESAA